MKITRRTVLRGLLGGAAVTVGLPWLERFADVRGPALAAPGGDGFPRRFDKCRDFGPRPLLRDLGAMAVNRKGFVSLS